MQLLSAFSQMNAKMWGVYVCMCVCVSLKPLKVGECQPRGTKRQWKQENKSKKEKEQKGMCCCVKEMKRYVLAWKLHTSPLKAKSAAVFCTALKLSAAAPHICNSFCKHWPENRFAKALSVIDIFVKGSKTYFRNKYGPTLQPLPSPQLD